MKTSIDVNCDLGEGVGNDAEIMPYISSCNIACGGHAGDKNSMREITALALLHDVRIGAHPSYPDKENFGRKKLELSNDYLAESLVAQVQGLKVIVENSGGKLHHLKPHGALYNNACVDNSLANVVIQVIKYIDSKLILYAPHNSIVAKLAIENGVSVMYEAFADRNYNDDMTLVSRDLDNALITDPELVFQHVLRLLDDKVETISGKTFPIEADTVCVHGDTDNAASILKQLHEKCLSAGISIE